MWQERHRPAVARGGLQTGLTVASRRRASLGVVIDSGSIGRELGATDFEAACEALLSGDPTTAAALLERRVAESPADIDARYWLASARLTAGHPQASAALDDARTLHALLQARAMGADLKRCESDGAYASSLAGQFYASGCVAISSVIRRVGLAAGAADAESLLGYGLALQHQGRADEACKALEAAAEAYPAAHVGQFAIYPQLLCEQGERRQFEAARDWAKRYANAPPPAPYHNRPLSGRKLRIGYVAPWFAKHQLNQFITPLLERHDPARVSVTLYPASADSEAGWPSWIDIHPIGTLSDAEAAELIRRDEIDVLADCWGHSAGSRLLMFARRPAPVQVAWLNFVQTTGLSQIDYVLHADAPQAPTHALFTEQIWPIGPVFTVFRAAPGRLSPTPTPALRTGQVTLGSFNHPSKLSGETLDAWAAILRGAGHARLLLKYSYFVDPVLQRVTQARLAARGVAPERILFAGHSAGEDYFRSFQAIDLMLDAWPAPGSTTTLEALSNGVPVLVKAGDDVPGRYVRSMLEACALPELIAADARDFSRRGLALIADPTALDALRARVRPGFDEGPLSDELRFTRRVEAAFAEMFEAWLQPAQPRQANG